MSRIFVLTIMILCAVSTAPASDSGADPNVCENLQGDSSPARETLGLDELPRGVVCGNDAGLACPAVGTLAWVGRTESGTRFWAKTADDLAGAASPVTLEILREIEATLPDFRPTKGLDLSESVIRVYDADGNQYQERKIRFGSLPTDLMLDLRRRAEKTEAESTVGVGLDPKGNTIDFYRPLTDPLLYTPIIIDAGLVVPNPCGN